MIPEDELRYLVARLDRELLAQECRVGILMVFDVEGTPRVASPYDDAQRTLILTELLEQHLTEQHGRPMRVRVEPSDG